MSLGDELRALCADGDVRDRLVEAAALLAQALREVGIEPILVGGGAAQFHTAGGYVSGDIDFIASGDPQPVLEALGFEKKGRHYIQPEIGLWVEFPSGQLDPGESTILVDVRGRKLRILSAPDLLLDRLNGFKWGGADVDGITALMLLRLDPEIASDDVRRRAMEQSVSDVLEGLLSEIESADDPDAIVRRVRQRPRQP